MTANSDEKRVSWSEVGAGGGVGTLVLLSVKYKVVDGGIAELLMFSSPFLSVASAALYTQLVEFFKEKWRSYRTNSKLNAFMDRCDTALADNHLQPETRQQILAYRNKAQVVVLEDTLKELNDHLGGLPKINSFDDMKINNKSSPDEGSSPAKG